MGDFAAVLEYDRTGLVVWKVMKERGEPIQESREEMLLAWTNVGAAEEGVVFGLRVEMRQKCSGN